MVHLKKIIRPHYKIFIGFLILLILFITQYLLSNTSVDISTSSGKVNFLGNLIKLLIPLWLILLTLLSSNKILINILFPLFSLSGVIYSVILGFECLGGCPASYISITWLQEVFLFFYLLFPIVYFIHNKFNTRH
jgi:hypothetical protein